MVTGSTRSAAAGQQCRGVGLWAGPKADRCRTVTPGCPDENTLAAHVAGSRVSTVVAHLDGCGRCRAEVSALLAARTGAEPAAAPEPLSPGARLGPYRVERLLGRGGMGEVHVASDATLGRTVALKVLHPDALGDAQATARFLFEAQATAAFNHPNIVTVFGAGEANGRHWVALEHLDGETLEQRLRRGPLDAPQVRRIGLGIARAIDEAHRHQLLHRDLKPENVFLLRDGRVKVLDFGLAKRLADQEVAGGSAAPTGTFRTHGDGLRGTPLFMAPEQWSQAPTTPATDVWALGLVLAQLATGRHPLAGHSWRELRTRVLEGRLVIRASQVQPRALGAFVARCLALEPSQRPSAAEAVAVLESLETPASPRRWWALAAVVALLVGVGAWWKWPAPPAAVAPAAPVVVAPRPVPAPVVAAPVEAPKPAPVKRAAPAVKQPLPGGVIADSPY